ncbi:MAG: cytochrome c [Amylibacter sp.]
MTKPKRIIKERMDGMGVLSTAMKSILTQTQSKTPNAEILKQAAPAIQDHTGAAMTKRFHEGSFDQPSEAKKEIWQDWTRFEHLAQQLDLHAKGLELAAANPLTGKTAELRDDRALSNFASLGPDEVFTLIGKNCVACLKEFRAKKK